MLALIISTPLYSQEKIKFEFNGVTQMRFDTMRIEFLNLYRNVLIGENAGFSLSPNGSNDGTSNVMIGYKSGNLNTNGNQNTFIGASAGSQNMSGSFNVFIGDDSGGLGLTGSQNTLIGSNAGLYATGMDNTFIGFVAGENASSGIGNTAIGSYAGRNCIRGSRNTVLGYGGFFTDTAGVNNVVIGYEAGGGFSYRSDTGNVYIGYRAGYESMGNNRLFIENSDSPNPLIYGEFDNDLIRINGTLNINNKYSFPLMDGNAGQSLQTDGSGLLSWKNLSLLSDNDGDTKINLMTFGDEDVIRFFVDSGERMSLNKTALNFSTNNNNLFIGANSGVANTTGANNTFLGQFPGISNTMGSDNVFLGNFVGNNTTTGGENIFIGNSAGSSNSTGSGNIMLGHHAGSAGTPGTPYNDNVFVGKLSGISIDNASKNVFIGAESGLVQASGNHNVYIGNQAGSTILSGRKNIFLGAASGTIGADDSLNICLGYQSGNLSMGSNKLFIDNSNTVNPLIYGEFDNDIISLNAQVGIGTSSPGQALVVKDATALASEAVVNVEFTGTNAVDLYGLHVKAIPQDYYGYGGYFQGGYKGIESVVLPSGGNTYYGLLSRAEGGSGSNYGVYGTATGLGSNYGIIGNASGGSTNHAVYANGDLTYSGNLNGPSDRRLKKDIQQIHGAMDIIAQMKPSVYRYKSDEFYTMNLPEGQRYGFIAQDLKKVLPTLVKSKGVQTNISTSKENEETRQEANEWMMSVNMIEIIPILTKAVQEQQSQINSLESEIDDLRSELDRLKLIENKVKILEQMIRKND